ncbi:hypothetical protein B0H11DRAFT_1996360 [Mycena galericulata]|nr:hypothetical protein B0H11DRAFT_1996360 [Mycena galericulata]
MLRGILGSHFSNGEAETEGGSTATTEDEDEDEDGPTSEHVDPEVSDVEAEREGSSTANTEDEVEAGSASEGGACNQQPCPCHPTTVDAEIAELHAESEGSCPATNEDEDCDELTLQDDHSVTDVELSWSWKAIMSVKLGLILALGFNSLCEYGRAVLSQRDI